MSVSKQSGKRRQNRIVIDPEKGLEFSSEDELYAHFHKDISALEGEYLRLRSDRDIPEPNFRRYEKHLGQLLEDPDEVWCDYETLSGKPIFFYLRDFSAEGGPDLFHVAAVYMANQVPSFVYLHFPTSDIELAHRYQRGELIFDRVSQGAPPGACEGDALFEGDKLASGLYEAMLKLRGEDDIREADFRDYFDQRDVTIEEADEIWRSHDTFGNTLVTFIRECEEEGRECHYVVVTLEDNASSSHALLFSFPTRDRQLLERYRHGENLQADEVVQEASH